MEKKCSRCSSVHTRPRSVFCTQACQQAAWVDRNRSRHNAAVREYRARRYRKDGRWRASGPVAQGLEVWLAELKSRPCSDCGNKFEACCMDFDHVRGEKKYNLGSMFAHHYSRELIEEELAKCDLVCSNCHRVRTRDRRTGNGRYRVEPLPKDPSLE